MLITFGVDSKTEIASTLSDYTTSAQLHTDLYNKVETNIICDTFTTTTQLYEGFASKLYIDNMCLTSVQTEALYYNKTDTDNLLADKLTSVQTEALYYNKTDTDNLLANKVSAIGDISLPGMHDIGITYTSSRIRCNAEVGGYTGYAKLQAANTYDMFLNLSTTRTNGGWMYFKINGDSYMQISGSDNKANIKKH